MDAVVLLFAAVGLIWASIGLGVALATIAIFPALGIEVRLYYVPMFIMLGPIAAARAFLDVGKDDESHG